MSDSKPIAVFILPTRWYSLSTVKGCLLALVILTLFSCGGTKKAMRYDPQDYKSIIQHSPVFKKGFTGFVLYDPQKAETIFESNADQHFTPASNTKILTLFAATKIIGDSIPLFQYQRSGDSLIFWGTGYPGFIHPELPRDTVIQSFLSDRAEQLFYYEDHFQDYAFGPGWAWDDYPYAFQVEKSAFPIHGNFIRLKGNVSGPGFTIAPGLFYANLKNEPDHKKLKITRNLVDNTITMKGKLKVDQAIDIPYKNSTKLSTSLLTSVLNKRVWLIEKLPPTFAEKKIVYGNSIDTLYRMMMHQSDNFIAEQLLLTCSFRLNGQLDSKQTIKFIRKNLLPDLGTDIRWVDGSGLSRYNLMTPRTIIEVLNNLYLSIERERLFSIFATGGEQGTIKDWYGGSRPYVYAKTGSLSGVHCLSGYVVTDKGRVLIFSFMHNNFIGSSRNHKIEMERILQLIKANE